MQEEHEAVTKELKELEKEMQELDEREREFWDECNEYQIKLQNFQNERDSLNMKYDHDVKQLERLQKTVVYNDAFCISQDGPFGTINGFRLGRLSSQQVRLPLLRKRRARCLNKTCVRWSGAKSMQHGVKPCYCCTLWQTSSNSSSKRKFRRVSCSKESANMMNRYRLVPMGSFSRVEKVDGDSVLSYEL